MEEGNDYQDLQEKRCTRLQQLERSNITNINTNSEQSIVQNDHGTSEKG